VHSASLRPRASCAFVSFLLRNYAPCRCAWLGGRSAAAACSLVLLVAGASTQGLPSGLDACCMRWLVTRGQDTRLTAFGRYLLVVMCY